MKKGGFFNKPDWLKNKEKSEKGDPKTEEKKDDATQMFARSVGTVSDALAEQKRKERLRTEKKATSGQRVDDSPKVKRRRMSEDGEYEDGREDKKDSISPHRTIATRQSAQASPQSLTKRYEAAIQAQNQKKANVIELSDGTDSDSSSTPSPKPQMSKRVLDRKPRAKEPQEEDEEEDEELAELAAAARARVRLQEQERKNSGSNTHSHDVGQNSESPRPADTGPNPVIDILVWSTIEGTKPLLVKRKWNQNFRDIRRAWLERQLDLPANLKKEDVYFTWRNKKVFDVGSCRSLGVKLDQYGNAIIPNDQGQYRDVEDRITLCATTDAQQKMEKEKAEEEQRRKEREEEEPEPEPEHAPMQATQSNGIRIILKAKGFPDQKLIVKPDTQVERLEGAFRRANKIEDAKTVVLMIDGDELASDTTMEDAEIEDMNMVEVYVR